MSQENVAAVQSALEAFERDGDAFIAHLDPDIEWAPFEERHTPSHGHEGARQIRQRWLETWEGHQVDVDEVLDGGDQIVVSMRLSGHGKLSGVEVDVRLYVQFEVRDGKIASIYEHEDRAEALEAAGLRE